MSVLATPTVAATLHVPGDYPDIQSAINASVNGDVIEIGPGNFMPSATLNTLGKAITLRGTVNADGSLASALDGLTGKQIAKCVSGEGPLTRFESLKFRRGKAGSGGAISVSSCGPTIVNCVFDANVATAYGGAIWMYLANPVVSGCVFQGNSTSGSPTYGGAISMKYSAPIITDCTFTGNTAPGGGAIHIDADASPLIARCQFRGNSSTIGGGMYIVLGASAIVTDTVFCGNIATGGVSSQIRGIGWTDGGGNCFAISCTDSDGDGTPNECGSVGDGVHRVPSEYATIQAAIAGAGDGDIVEIDAGTFAAAATIDTHGKRLTIRGTTNADGTPATEINGQGARMVIQCSNGEGPATVFEHLRIANGLATYGAGMSVIYSGPTLRHCVFSGNHAATAGGAMRVQTARPVVTACTFQGNAVASLSGTGGAIWVSEGPSNLTVEDSVFCGNTAVSGAHLYIATGGWNDAGGNCFAFSCTDSDGDGSPNECGTVGDGVHLVPQEYATVTAAILAAGNGDVVQLAAGTFAEAATLDPRGKRLTVRGAVNPDGTLASVLDGLGNKRLVKLTGGEGPATRFENLRMTNGLAGYGGAVAVYGASSPTIINCILAMNTASYGGGALYVSPSSNCAPTISDTVFCSNQAPAAHHVLGHGWIDGGDNCFANSCTDTDGDGHPNECGTVGDGVHEVPGEYTTIEAAIAAAGSGDVVSVGPGVYSPAIPLDTMGKRVTVRGATDPSGSPATTLDGVGLRQLIRCTNQESAETSFENLTIRNGSGTDGGGVYLVGSGPTFRNCRFNNSTATLRGGGMFITDYATPTLVDCAFELNQADSGGAMFVQTHASLTLVACTFQSNQAYDGGAMVVDSDCALTVTDCAFNANHATSSGGGGGAAYIDGHSNASMSNCSFASNTAVWGGGALVFDNGSDDVVLTDCLFEGNSAKYGGAMAFDASNPACSGCTIRDNQASIAGGGVAVFGWGTPTIGDSVLCGNSAPADPQIWVSYADWVDAGGNCFSSNCSDTDGGGWPDECQYAEGDFDLDGTIGGGDLALLLSVWGAINPPWGDLSGDGLVSGADVALLFAKWGESP